MTIDWNGEGLPPVGAVCEYDGTAITREWFQVKIIAHTEKRGYQVAVFEYGDVVSFSSQSYFRPIRTPAQIAIEEREKACAEWYRGIEQTYGEEVADRCEEILKAAEQLKQVTP